MPASRKWAIPKKIGKIKKKARKQLIPSKTCMTANQSPARITQRKFARLVPVILDSPNRRVSISSLPNGNAAKPAMRNAAIPKGIPTTVQQRSRPSSNQTIQATIPPPNSSHKIFPAIVIMPHFAVA